MRCFSYRAYYEGLNAYRTNQVCYPPCHIPLRHITSWYNGWYAGVNADFKRYQKAFNIDNMLIW